MCIQNHLLEGPYSALSDLSLERHIERHLISHGCPVPLSSLPAKKQLQAAQMYSQEADLSEPFHHWTRADAFKGKWAVGLFLCPD